MRTSCPFVEKFFVDVETYYYPDAGQQVQYVALYQQIINTLIESRIIPYRNL